MKSAIRLTNFGRQLQTASKSLSVAVFLFVAATASAANAVDGSFLLPRPQRIILSAGQVSQSDIRSVLLPREYTLSLPSELDCLPRNALAGITVELKLEEDGASFKSGEAYILEISKKRILISAISPEGLFYGATTLSQLMRDAADRGAGIRCMTVEDWPDMDFRCAHIDTKHHLDRIENYYRMVDRLASWKVNNIIWELEDKLAYSSHPEIASPNAISKQEMVALSEYAFRRNIRIHPLVQGLGHAGYILKRHWELREDPQSDWEFCPSNPGTYDMLFDLYDEAIEAMPHSRYLHIGGDEVSGIGTDKRCLETGKTPFELQMEWLRRVCDFARSRGRIPIFWDDMPLKNADLWWVLHRPLTDAEVEANWDTSKLDSSVSLFPQDCVFMRWEYEDPTRLSHRKVLEWYKEHRLDVIAATAVATDGTAAMPRNDSRAQYIRDFCILARQNDFRGIMAAGWDDASPHSETLMRGYAALGDFSWNTDGHDVDGFISAFSVREWGLDPGQTAFVRLLEQSASWYDNALVSEGSRNPTNEAYRFTPMDLPDPDSPGEWSKKYHAALDDARAERDRADAISAALVTVKSCALRNRYSLEIYEQLNNLFSWSADLILALGDYDTSRSEAALSEVREVCDRFDTMRQGLERVYSEVRHMKCPEGYVADQNHHHHLAALDCGDDWMFLYELPMLSKVNDWLE